MNWKNRFLALALCCLALPAMGQLIKVHAELWQGDIYDNSKKRITDTSIVTKSGEPATATFGQKVLDDEPELMHGTILTAEVTETDGQCIYRCLLVERKLQHKDASTTSDTRLAFNTQEYLLRGEMPLGGKKEYQFDDGRTLILSIEPQAPIKIPSKQESEESFRIIIGNPNDAE